MAEYIVVFEFKEPFLDYGEGDRTWTCFRDKDSFMNWYDDDKRKRFRVLRYGITEKEAGKLTRATGKKMRIIRQARIIACRMNLAERLY